MSVVKKYPRRVKPTVKPKPKHYAQNGEDLFILSRLSSGTILEIGANSGEYLSNSKLLIEQGFSAYLVEPGETYNKLKELHRDNDKVKTFNFGIAEADGEKIFYQSGEHEPGKGDIGLVSTTIPNEMERWVGVEFKETEAQFKTFSSFYKIAGSPLFDVISIDCEGYDWTILHQIDLKKVGCKYLIIEWNGLKELRLKFSNYCRKFGMREVHRNPESLIFH